SGHFLLQIHCRVSDQISSAVCLGAAVISSCRWPHVVRRGHTSYISPQRRPRAQDFAGHEARRLAGRAAHEVRLGDQSQDCEGDWPHYPGILPSARRRGDRMRRRTFISLLGAVGAWRLAPSEGEPAMPGVGVLNDIEEGEPFGQAQLAAFRDELGKLGGTDGSNVRIDYRTGAADSDAIRTYAAEIIASRPDVVLAAAQRFPRDWKRRAPGGPSGSSKPPIPAAAGPAPGLGRPAARPPAFTQSDS